MIVVSTDLNLSEIASIAGDYKIKEAFIVSLDNSTKEAMILDNSRVGIDQTPNNTNALPNGYQVSNAYPNPFNPTTSFNVDLDQDSFVSIKAYNILGQLAAEVYSGNMLAGYNNQIIWDASNVSSGIYFMQIQIDNHLESQKVLLVK